MIRLRLGFEQAVHPVVLQETAMSEMPKGVQIIGPKLPASDTVLTPEALAFLAGLQREFNAVRKGLLQRRAEVAQRIQAGEKPAFLEHTRFIREGDWKVAPAPPTSTTAGSRLPAPPNAK